MEKPNPSGDNKAGSCEKHGKPQCENCPARKVTGKIELSLEERQNMKEPYVRSWGPYK